ncbi:PREDICTED: stress response protein nst1-like [Priapulus caudatus]|uniref:Stress response protein nst1-like n=1 Tax=Priapulus caudatus TaxID=37621 RepID=A0ABM1EN88_PRICU|nr:PREDICTED: stress response protein nst1-like [Priapulus caudatus]
MGDVRTLEALSRPHRRRRIGEINKKFHEARVRAEDLDKVVADLKSKISRAEDVEDKLTAQLASLGKTHRREAEERKASQKEVERLGQALREEASQRERMKEENAAELRGAQRKLAEEEAVRERLKQDNAKLEAATRELRGVQQQLADTEKQLTSARAATGGTGSGNNQGVQFSTRSGVVGEFLYFEAQANISRLKREKQCLSEEVTRRKNQVNRLRALIKLCNCRSREQLMQQAAIEDVAPAASSSGSVSERTPCGGLTNSPRVVPATASASVPPAKPATPDMQPAAATTATAATKATTAAPPAQRNPLSNPENSWSAMFRRHTSEDSIDPPECKQQ